MADFVAYQDSVKRERLLLGEYRSDGDTMIHAVLAGGNAMQLAGFLMLTVSTAIAVSQHTEELTHKERYTHLIGFALVFGASVSKFAVSCLAWGDKSVSLAPIPVSRAFPPAVSTSPRVSNPSPHLSVMSPRLSVMSPRAPTMSPRTLPTSARVSGTRRRLNSRARRMVTVRRVIDAVGKLLYFLAICWLFTRVVPEDDTALAVPLVRVSRYSESANRVGEVVFKTPWLYSLMIAGSACMVANPLGQQLSYLSFSGLFAPLWPSMAAPTIVPILPLELIAAILFLVSNALRPPQAAHRNELALAAFAMFLCHAWAETCVLMLVAQSKDLEGANTSKKDTHNNTLLTPL